jgi:N-acetylglucosaminyl-diphospho-decaprenol L-rhamnosyltransferase
VRVIRCANLGFAHGNNAALAYARGRFVLLLNPDVEVRRGSLDELVAALDARPGVGAASVIQRGTDGELLPSIRRFPTPGRDLGEALFAARWPALRAVQELDVDFDRYSEERSADWLSGAFLIVRSKAIEEVGRLDERFFLYSEEIDWCYRLRRAGWDIRHLPVMEVTHHCGPSEAPQLVAELSHSRVLFAQKHYGPARATMIRLALTFKHLVRLLLLALPAVLRPSLRKRLRAQLFGLAVIAGRRRPPLSEAARASLTPAEGTS